MTTLAVAMQQSGNHQGFSFVIPTGDHYGSQNLSVACLRAASSIAVPQFDGLCPTRDDELTFIISEFNRPVRPGTTQDGTGRCHAVRPRAGRKRCRLFEPGRGRTNETAGDGEVPSPAVIYRHPWILLSVLEQLYNSHYNTRYNHSDINARFFSNLTLAFL